MFELRRSGFLGAAVPIVAVAALLAGALVPPGVAGFSGPVGEPPRTPVASAPFLPSERAVPSAAAAAVAPPWPAAVIRTLLPNYNGSIAGNFASTVGQMQVGVPVYLPSTQTLWWPELATATNQTPAPPAAPTLVYSVAAHAFTGLDAAVQNVTAFALDSADGLVFAAEPGNDTVDPISIGSGLPSGPAIPVGSYPDALAVDGPLHELFVANRDSNNISVISTLTDRVFVAGTAVGNAPVALALDAADGWVYAACANSSNLSVLDLANLSAPAFEVSLSNGPAVDLAYSTSTGQILVAEPSNSSLTIVDARTRAAVYAFVATGASVRSVAVSPNGSEFVAANYSGGGLATVGASFPFVVANAPTAAGPRSRALAADPIHGGVLVWSDAARTVAELNLSSLNLSAPTPTLAPEPGAVAYDAADGRLFAADAALPGVESMMPFAGSTTSTTPLPAPPSSVVVAPNGSWVYAALPGEVVAIAAATGALVGSAALNGTNGPLVVDPTSGLVWVGRPDLAMWIGVNLSTLAVGPTAQARPGLDAGLPDLATLVPGSDRIAVLNLSSPGTAIEFNASTGRTVGVVTGLGANATALAYDSADALVYAAGDTLSAFDPVQSVVDVRGAPLGPHASVAAMTFDPAVARILVRTIGPSGAGTVASVDGASPRGANGSLLLAPVGLGNGSLVAGLPGSSSALAGAGLLLTANSFSGTVSVLGSPPTVASFAFAPASVDLGGTTVGAVAAAGGAGPLTASYSGLPSGCGSSSSLALLCSPTATGTYNVTVRLTDALGDAGSGRAPLVVAGALTVLAAPVGPAGGAVDVGVALTFDATAGGGSPPYRYSWTFGDGATGTGASPRHTYAAAGSVVATVLVQDTGGGVGAASVAVQVVPLPTIAIAAGPAGWSADNGSVSNLSATIVGGVGPGTVAWQFSDGGPMASGASVVHTWHHAGLVAVTATFTDAWGVTNRTSATMRVYSALAASVSTDPNSTSFGPSSSVTFAARPSGGSGSYSYFWAFGDGTSAVGPSVVHTFGRTGNYTVELTVTDSVGGSYATAIRVTVASLAPAAPDWLGTGAGPALVLGLVVGATLAAVVLFAAERSKHRRPVRPPEPFEPPAGPRER